MFGLAILFFPTVATCPSDWRLEKRHNGAVSIIGLCLLISLRPRTIHGGSFLWIREHHSFYGRLTSVGWVQ